MSPTRLLSPSEMPGLNTMLIVNVPSLNGGRKARGSMNAAIPGDDDRDRDCAHHHAGVVERPGKGALLTRLQARDQPAFLLVEPLQTRAEGR